LPKYKFVCFWFCLSYLGFSVIIFDCAVSVHISVLVGQEIFWMAAIHTCIYIHVCTAPPTQVHKSIHSTKTRIHLSYSTQSTFNIEAEHMSRQINQDRQSNSTWFSGSSLNIKTMHKIQKFRCMEKQQSHAIGWRTKDKTQV